MSCVLSKEKVKINNMLPKNHEIASTFGEITLRKDRFDILCFEINCDKFSSCKKKIDSNCVLQLHSKKIKRGKCSFLHREKVL